MAARLLRRLRKLRDRGLRGESIGEKDLDGVFADLDEYYARTAAVGSRLGVRCTRGCSNCCHQMVYGLHSFEAERIGRALEREGRAVEIREALERREAAFAATLPPVSTGNSEKESVEEDRALAFFARRWPCVFLTDDGSCSIHRIRPYSCRRFFSLSDPELCTAEGVVRREYRGFLFEPSVHLDRAMAELDGVLDFDAGTERLDKALLAWWNRS